MSLIVIIDNNYGDGDNKISSNITQSDSPKIQSLNKAIHDELIYMNYMKHILNVFICNTPITDNNNTISIADDKKKYFNGIVVRKNIICEYIHSLHSGDGYQAKQPIIVLISDTNTKLEAMEVKYCTPREQGAQGAQDVQPAQGEQGEQGVPIKYKIINILVNYNYLPAVLRFLGTLDISTSFCNRTYVAMDYIKESTAANTIIYNLLRTNGEYIYRRLRHQLISNGVRLQEYIASLSLDKPRQSKKGSFKSVKKVLNPVTSTQNTTQLSDNRLTANPMSPSMDGGGYSFYEKAKINNLVITAGIEDVGKTKTKNYVKMFSSEKTKGYVLLWSYTDARAVLINNSPLAIALATTSVQQYNFNKEKDNVPQKELIDHKKPDTTKRNDDQTPQRAIKDVMKHSTEKVTTLKKQTQLVEREIHELEKHKIKSVNKENLDKFNRDKNTMYVETDGIIISISNNIEQLNLNADLNSQLETINSDIKKIEEKIDIYTAVVDNLTSIKYRSLISQRDKLKKLLSEKISEIGQRQIFADTERRYGKKNTTEHTIVNAYGKSAKNSDTNSTSSRPASHVPSRSATPTNESVITHAPTRSDTPTDDTVKKLREAQKGLKWYNLLKKRDINQKLKKLGAPRTVRHNGNDSSSTLVHVLGGGTLKKQYRLH